MACLSGHLQQRGLLATPRQGFHKLVRISMSAHEPVHVNCPEVSKHHFARQLEACEFYSQSERSNVVRLFTDYQSRLEANLPKSVTYFVTLHSLASRAVYALGALFGVCLGLLLLVLLVGEATISNATGALHEWAARALSDTQSVAIVVAAVIGYFATRNRANTATAPALLPAAPSAAPPAVAADPPIANAGNLSTSTSSKSSMKQIPSFKSLSKGTRVAVAASNEPLAPPFLRRAVSAEGRMTVAGAAGPAGDAGVLAASLCSDSIEPLGSPSVGASNHAPDVSEAAEDGSHLVKLLQLQKALLDLQRDGVLLRRNDQEELPLLLREAGYDVEKAVAIAQDVEA